MKAIPKREDFILYYDYASDLEKWSEEAEKENKEFRDILSNIYHLDKVSIFYKERIKKLLK